MVIVQVAPKIMALTVGHKNLKTLGKYDRCIFLKHFATQVLLQHPYNEKIGEFSGLWLTLQWTITIVSQERDPWIGCIFFGINIIPSCISLVELVVSMDFDWLPIISSTSIPILNPSTPLMVELNVPLHQTMDLASNALK